LEIVAIVTDDDSDDEAVIIHAMRLRKSFHSLLPPR
jgi:hypothetical protein